MKLLVTLLEIYEVIIILRAIFSWFAPSPQNTFNRFLTQITEPVLGPLRRVLPQTGAVDLSPLVALLIIQIIRSMLIQSLH